jgi:uncharacterized protein with HEPN domain
VSFSAKERDQDYCRVIVEAFGYIERYLDGLSHNDFALDSKTQDAVAMRLQQILECAAKLSSASKSDLKINWSALTAMRNKISHSYVDVDYEIVWQVIRDLKEFSALIAWARRRI